MKEKSWLDFICVLLVCILLFFGCVDLISPTSEITQDTNDLSLVEK